MRRGIFTAAFALLVFFPLAAPAAFPRPQGFVNDFAGALSPDVRRGLESTLSAFERQTGIEVAVVTLPSLDGAPIEDSAVKLFQEWGIGKKGKDNGALFLIAPTERKVRIEVGYGLEGAINDALAGRLLDEYVIPRFREGDMSGGIAQGAMALVSKISEKEGIAFDPRAHYGADAPELTPIDEERGGPVRVLFRIFILIAMIILSIRYPWLLFFFLGSGRGGGGGGFGGGFGGFGGGLSGGGGASRGW